MANLPSGGEKYLNDYKHDSLHLAQKFARIFVRRHYLFQEANSKTVSFEQQEVLSKDKYSSIFSRQMEAIIFIMIQIFFTMHAVLKIEEHHLDIPQF